MRNNRTILGAIPVHTPNNHAIRPRTSPTICLALLDREFQIRGVAVEGKAFVVIVLVGIVVPADGFTVVVVAYCGGGGVVDIVL